MVTTFVRTTAAGVLAAVLIVLFALLPTGVSVLILDQYAHAQAQVVACPPVAWHEPGVHDDFGAHEHGDAPPDWVVQSRWKPFSQCREGHTGYKGVLSKAEENEGVESYVIPHILSTHGARSHGDHDYELWVRGVDGLVSHWGRSGRTNTSVLDFGDSPTQQRCNKSGFRPSQEQDRTADIDNEAWYQSTGGRQNLAIGIGYVMYGPNHQMDGTTTNGKTEPVCPPAVLGDGSYRQIGWSVTVKPDVYGTPVPSLSNWCSFGPKGCMYHFGRSNDWADEPMSVPN